MANHIQHPGSFESTAQQDSATDYAGSFVDLETGGAYARFGAKGPGSVGVKLRSMLAGVAVIFMTAAASGAVTFAENVSMSSGKTLAAQAITATTVTASSTVASAGAGSIYTGGEFAFTNTGANLQNGIYGVSTGTPTMSFDHRATGNSGVWVWRNSTAATQTAMALSAGGLLTAASGFSVGSAGGSLYGGGELGFTNTGNGLQSGIYGLSVGAPTMTFDHRATSNTGSWLWRNGTGAATTRMTLGAAGTLSVFAAFGTPNLVLQHTGSANDGAVLQLLGYANTNPNWQIDAGSIGNQLSFTPSTAAGGSTFTTPAFALTSAGAAAFTGSVRMNGAAAPSAGIGFASQGVDGATSFIGGELLSGTNARGIVLHYTDSATYNMSSGADGSGNAVWYNGRYPGTAGTLTMQLSTAGAMKLPNYGAGTATFDASGNITSVSDERHKTRIRKWTRGMADLRGVETIIHGFNKASGLDMESDYIGFSAQNLRKNIPETVFEKNGVLSMWDRGILATHTNALQELDRRLATLEKRAA